MARYRRGLERNFVAALRRMLLSLLPLLPLLPLPLSLLLLSSVPPPPKTSVRRCRCCCRGSLSRARYSFIPATLTTPVEWPLHHPPGELHGDKLRHGDNLKVEIGGSCMEKGDADLKIKRSSTEAREIMRVLGCCKYLGGQKGVPRVRGVSL